jgi:glucose-6-phosphate isomerase
MLNSLGIRNHAGRLLFEARELAEPAHSARLLSALEPVLLTPLHRVNAAADVAIYDMYRNVHVESHAELLESRQVRYDITVIYPIPLGQEYPKTYGHYHPVPPGRNASYPELYQVLSGRANYLIQRRDPEGLGLDRAICIEAQQGDVVAMPPGYGHVTINPHPSPLVMANWVASDFDSVYDDYEELGGACYYQLNNGSFIENPSYGHVPELETVSGRRATTMFLHEANQQLVGTPSDVSCLFCVYDLFLQNPELFEFLHNPSLLDDLYSRQECCGR